MVARFLGQKEHGEQAVENFERSAALFGVSPQNFAPFFFASSPQGTQVLLKAHRESAAAIRAERGKIPVGVTIAMQDLQAVEGGEDNRDRLRHDIQDIWLEAAREDEFVGVQTYSRERIGPDGLLGSEEGVELTQMGYEYWPQAIEATLRYAYQVANVNLMVTENGIGTQDDTRRVAYYQRALQGVASTLDDGLPIKGYFAWSAFDNFEWMRGYEPQFGLIHVVRETQKRTVKPSARLLGDIARANRF